ncbi:MAG TPA: ABC transporter permease [Terracidiphilus sp.]|nr:ABC transporter permease [Terracidiphilus sp.]
MANPIGKIRALWLRLHGMVDGEHENEDFAAELESHLAMHIEEGMRAGLSAEEARRQALMKLGGAEQTRQAYRERVTLPRLENIVRDMGFALRQMRRKPGFTMTAVLTLALGIGANAVIYTLVDSILLRPLPYPHQDRLTRITYDPDEANGGVFPKGWIRALGEHSTSFSSFSGYGADVESNVAEGDTPERVFGAQVMSNAMDTLDMHPAAGRSFAPDDAIADHPPVVMISYGFWRQRYGLSPQAVGQNIRIDGVWRKIVGVMPEGVRFPYADTEFITPITFNLSDAYEPWQNFDLVAFARLKPGIKPAQAQAELRILHNSLLPLFPWRMPDSWAASMTVVPLLEFETGSMRPRLLLLFGAVGLILLIACANVANLMLARATAREREIAIRGALGASGGRLIQQILVESIVLGVTAGIVGLAAAFASLRLFAGLLPADTPRINNISVNLGDILFTLGASVVAGLIFGLIPAIKMASFNLLTTLRMGSRTLSAAGARFGLSMMLVVAQIGLSVMVVTAAGLILHSLYKLSRVDPGFRTDHTVTAEVALDAAACGSQGRCKGFLDSLLERAQSIAGVQSVALTDSLPLSGRDNNYVYDAQDHNRNPREGALMAAGRTVSPGYFNVLSLRLMQGRLLDEQDASGASHAVVINEQMANHLWPNQSPLGKKLINVDDEPSPTVWDATKVSIIVGVVQNAREGSLAGGYGDEIYLPMTPTRQNPVMYVLLRTHTTTAETAEGLRSAVAGIDSLIPVTRVRTMDQLVSTSVAAPRALAVLLVGFGALAVIIGAVGVYSLIAYIVSWRTREIGLRLALGAQRWQIVMAVVRQSLFLAGAGCVAGLVGAALLGRVLRGFLFEVGALDPITYCAVPLVMLLVALVAAWVPARRAAAVDPMEALRAD